MDNQFARPRHRRDDAADRHCPDILDTLVRPLGAQRLPDSLPGVAAPRPYVRGVRAAAHVPPATATTRPEVAMSESTTSAAPQRVPARPAADDAGANAGTLLRPVPLAPLADPAPARGRARVPRMREPEGMKVDLLGVWHAKDRQAPLPAVIWEELTATHPELFEADD